MKELNILYRDEWMVAVDKPAGHLVHPASDPKDDDLVAMKILRDQIGQRVNSIHRLDRPTSGVLLFGLEARATKALHKALARHEFRKEYLAVLDGAVCPEWTCKEPIQKTEGEPARDALTSFVRLGEKETPLGLLSLVRAIPHTGRFHQIRRHCLHEGNSIIGDYRYAGIKRSDEWGCALGTGSRMLLQAHRLTLLHPTENKEVVIEAPVLPVIGQLFVNP